MTIEDLFTALAPVAAERISVTGITTAQAAELTYKNAKTFFEYFEKAQARAEASLIKEREGAS